MNRNKIISTLLTCSTFSNNVSALENIISLVNIPNAGSLSIRLTIRPVELFYWSFLHLELAQAKFTNDGLRDSFLIHTHSFTIKKKLHNIKLLKPYIQYAIIIL